MLGWTKGWLSQWVGHLELAHRLEGFCAVMVHKFFKKSKQGLYFVKVYDYPPERKSLMAAKIKGRAKRIVLNYLHLKPQP